MSLDSLPHLVVLQYLPHSTFMIHLPQQAFILPMPSSAYARIDNQPVEEGMLGFFPGERLTTGGKKSDAICGFSVVDACECIAMRLRECASADRVWAAQDSVGGITCDVRARVMAFRIHGA